MYTWFCVNKLSLYIYPKRIIYDLGTTGVRKIVALHRKSRSYEISGHSN